MNILFVGGQDIPGIGGVESYILNLSKSLIDKGHNVTIICRGKVDQNKDLNGIKILHKKCIGPNLVAWFILLVKSICYAIENRKEIDVVNYHIISFGYLAKIILSLFRCNVCFTIHSFAKDSHKYNKLKRMLLEANTLLSMWSFGDSIITVSKSRAIDIKQSYGNNATIISCGINPSPQQVSSDILERFQIKPNKYYLTISRIDPIKNLDILIKAFIKNNDSEMQLVIAGDYENVHGRELRKIACSNKNILFVGSVMGDDKEVLLKNCFANCLVSSSEGMPISLLEAMVYAKPCIVTDIPAIREIMQSNWAMWCQVRDVDDTAKQLKRVKDIDASFRSDLVNMSNHIVANYLWNNLANKYIVYLTSKYKLNKQ